MGLDLEILGMHRIKASWLLVAVGCLVLMSLSWAGMASLRGDFMPATIDCVKTAEAEDRFNLLVIGESWAAGGLFFPELPQGVSQRLDRPVHACTIGFPGRNTYWLNKGVRAEFPLEKISAQFEGKVPDAVVIMNGVNDVLQHVGSESYSQETATLVSYFEGSAVQVISLPRVNELGASRSLPSAAKRYAQAWWYDGGEMQVNDLYRRRLRGDHPAIQLIEFDDFIPSYEKHKEDFMPDGAHLTIPAFQRYGAFIAARVAIQ